MNTVKTLSQTPALAGAETRHKPATYLVGIGTSAGGLEALSRLFQALPSSSGLAFVVIQHLSAEHPSLLGELLQKQTDMPVHSVTANTQIQAQQIYLNTHRSHLVLKDQELIAIARSPEQRLSFPIDLFLHSLAEAYGPQSVGVILSGMGTDGTYGMKSIQTFRGLTLAQTPASAQFGEMPESVLKLGLADSMQTPEQIAQTLARWSLRHNLPISVDTEPFQLLLQKLQSQIAVTPSSAPLLLRVLQKRLCLLNFPDLETYIQYLQQQPQEVKQLRHELLPDSQANQVTLQRPVSKNRTLPKFSELTFFEKVLLETHAPISLFVKRSGELLYTHGSLQSFAMLPRGWVTYHLSNLFYEAEWKQLQAGIEQVNQELEPLQLPAMLLTRQTRLLSAEIEIRPYWHPELAETIFLLAFRLSSPAGQGAGRALSKTSS